MADFNKYEYRPMGPIELYQEKERRDKERAEFGAKNYEAQTCCLNCGWNGILVKPKGERVKGTPCPHCECKLGMED